jgi:hypothetical protein
MDSDGLLMFLGVGTLGLPESADCVAYAQAIVREARRGPRRALSLGGPTILGSVPAIGSLQISVPPAWMIRNRAGADFDVWELRRATPQEVVGIYSGSHADFEPKGRPAFRDTVLGRRREWFRAAGECCRADMLLAIGKREVLHVWIETASVSRLTELRRVVQSLRLVRP